MWETVFQMELKIAWTKALWQVGTNNHRIASMDDQGPQSLSAQVAVKSSLAVCEETWGSMFQSSLPWT